MHLEGGLSNYDIAFLINYLKIIFLLAILKVMVMRVEIFSIEGIKRESREYSAPELRKAKRHGKKIDDPMTLGDYRVFEKEKSLLFLFHGIIKLD